MTVKELIEALSSLPPEAKVGYVWDGDVRSSAEVVWLSRSGEAVISDFGDYVYNEKSRPTSAPTEAEDRHWSAPTKR